jgi:peptide deformylase
VAVLTIRTVPDPVLFKKARKVAKIAPRHKKLTDDMVETMDHHNGVGLAANQVGVLERVAVVRTPEMEEAMVLVNPEIVRQEGEREVEEGCLSVPGYRGIVRRSLKVRVRAQSLDGKQFKRDAEELLAQALEHEIDHLNGILYMDHLISHETLRKVDESPDEELEEGDSDGPDSDEPDSGSGHSHAEGADSSFEELHRRLHGIGDESGARAEAPETPTAAPTA